MAFKRTSNLRATPVIDGYLDIYNPPIIPDFNQTEIVEITQKYNRRPDLLAYDLYGEARLWWLFALYNKNAIVDPINDFTTGTSIVVPLRSFVTGI